MRPSPARAWSWTWTAEEGPPLNAYLPTVIEILVLLLLWLVASGVSGPLRKRLHRDLGGAGLGSLLVDLLAHVSRPLLVLALTELAVLAVSPNAHVGGWIADRADHLTAWRMFWIGVLGVLLLEGIVKSLFRWRRRAFPVPDLLERILRGVLVMAVAFLVLRVEMGIDIGPLLASTALLSAVIGFALQGVLGNLLAGMSLHLVRTLKPGLWIEIDGIEGKVVTTNWRETRIRTRGGHLHVIPNAKVAEARVHNLNDPTPMRMHRVEVGASYSDEPDEVIAALLEAARSVPEVKRAPEPTVSITAYLDFGINYRLMYWTSDYPRHVAIDGEVNRMIWYKFKRRGIEIPFPMSDKLLNDFMAVVYNQRKLPPSDVELESVVDALEASDLCTSLLLDAEGNPLLDRTALEGIAPLVRSQPWTSGETLCSQGDDGETFWILATGELAGTVSADGETAAEFTLSPGCVVGEMGALTGVPRSATITVAESSRLLEFGPEAFRALLAVHPDVPARLSELAAERTEKNRASLEALARERADRAPVVLEKSGILNRLKNIVKRGRP